MYVTGYEKMVIDAAGQVSAAAAAAVTIATSAAAAAQIMKILRVSPTTTIKA